MATIGNLVIGVGANIGPLNAGLGQARASLSSFVSFASKVSGTGIVGMLGLGSLGGMINERLSEIKHLKREADALGISTESLSALQYAAGPAQEAFGIGLRKMTKLLGEVRQGSASAADKFELLGFDVNKLQQMKPDQAFREIARHISEMGNATDRAAAVFQIFGRNGQELLSMLAKGVAGLDEAMQKAKEKGLLISESDAAKAVAATKAMRENGLAFKGIVTDLAISFAPLISALAKIVSYLQEIKGLDPKGALFGARIGLQGAIYGPGPEKKKDAEQLAAFNQKQAEDARKTLRELEKDILNAGVEREDMLTIEQSRKVAEARRLGIRGHGDAMEIAFRKINRRNIDAFLGEQGAGMNRTPMQQQIEDFRKTGANERQVGEFGMNLAIKDLQESLKTFVDSLKGPLELFQDRQQAIAELQDKVFMAGDLGQMFGFGDKSDLAQAANFKALVRGAGLDNQPERMAEALTEGSAASISAINKFRRLQDVQTIDYAKQARDLLALIDEKEKQQLEEAKAIKAAIKAIPLKGAKF